MTSIQNILKNIEQKNPHEKEFLQAVKEVVTSLEGFLRDNPRYLEAKIVQRMAEPERVIMFKVPWVDDAGEVQINRGYRVQMNSAIGPYKGGLRFHPSVNLSVLKFLAFEQILKNSLTGLSLGGGKGGSDFDPKGKSDHEVMRFCQSFMTELSKHIGADTDVPAGDIGVGGREIAYLFGQYKRLQNRFTGTLTGKNIHQGGSLMRPEATGYGLVLFAENMLQEHNESLEGKTCLVSGSGNVAQHAIELLLQKGAKVVSVSDSSGTVYDEQGITSEKLKYIKQLKNAQRGRIKEYADVYDCEYREGQNPWSLSCDIAFPCATQNELALADAKKLVENKVMLVAEGANMPTTQDAVDLLLEHKILFAPGKAANAGGVAVSGLEMSQNALKLSWSEEEVLNRLKDIMKNIHTQCVNHGKQDDGFVNYVIGANVAGFIKVADAMLAQGVVS